MITILAKAETRFTEYEYQWTAWFCLAGAYGVNNKNIHLVMVDEFENKLNELEGKRVFLEPPINKRFSDREFINLELYTHPEECIYIFGNTETSNLEYVKDDDDIVWVEMQAMSSVNVFGVSIASIVLYDRYLKGK